MTPRQASNVLLEDWGRRVTGDVLSVGSGGDGDGRGTSYRTYFPHARRYVTSDLPPATGCDRVLDIRSMPEVADGSFDAIFCCGVLEHVDAVFDAVAECHRVLRPGGVFLVGVPFNWRIHRPPQDFWRFTEHGLRYLLRAFQIEDFRAIGTEAKFPNNYWAFARKGATC